jgi:tellurite resistance protein
MNRAQLPQSVRFAGIFTTAELLAAGFSKAKIAVLLKRGVLTKVCRGVYAPSGYLAELHGHDERAERLVAIAAAVATAGRRAVASHEDAAILHDLALLDRPRADLVTVSRPHEAPGSRTGRPGVRVREVALPAHHVTVGDGVPVTSVERTVIDLARTLPFRSGVVVADSALHAFKTGQPLLLNLIKDCSRWPGIKKARQVVDFSDPLAESPFESIARVAFRDGGLPRPMLQVSITEPARVIARVDFLWDKHATIAEADGAVKYADPLRARQQLRRDAELRSAGYEVVHFTWRELTSAPEQVIQSIRVAFGRAARLRGRTG